jgi:pimeloyl-ACP methyl ester carboxylesterase
MQHSMKERLFQLLVTLLCALAITSAGLVIACGGDRSTSTTAGAGQNGSDSTASGAGASETVSFTTEDGVTLSGHLFGSGTSGVVLAHMYPADQTSWYPTAERLAEEGYLVLTFDFRGYGDSEGTKQIELINKDVAAAIAELARAGATSVGLIGASMGGTASLIAASQTPAPIPIAGVATLSAPVEFRGLSAEQAVPKLTVPLLFIAAEDDSGADGARQLQELAGGEAELELFPGDEHGTELLEGPYAEDVLALLSGFLERVLPSAGD